MWLHSWVVLIHVHKLFFVGGMYHIMEKTMFFLCWIIVESIILQSWLIHVAIMDFFGSTKSIQSDWYIQFGSCLNIETISGSSVKSLPPISQCCARPIKNSEFSPKKAGARKPSQAWAWIGSLCFRHGSPAISWSILRAAYWEHHNANTMWLVLGSSASLASLVPLVHFRRGKVWHFPVPPQHPLPLSICTWFVHDLYMICTW